jgi:hypothetical protein
VPEGDTGPARRDAVRVFRRALEDFLDAKRSPRDRILGALLTLEPSLTNTQGLTGSQRSRFFNALGHVAACVDLESPDLTAQVLQAPDWWVEEVSLELTELLVEIVGQRR